MKMQCSLDICGSDLVLLGGLHEIKLEDVCDQVSKDILFSHAESDLLRVSLELTDPRSPKFRGGKDLI